MTAGPLHPDNLINGRDRDVTRGHGTRALGPSDSSDSASDLVGAPGLADPAVPDEELEAPRDILGADGRDIDTDHVERIFPEDLEPGEGEDAPRH